MAILEVKSKFNAEYRRFSLDGKTISKFDDFYHVVERAHGLYDVNFIIQYVDPKESSLLPINNDKNCERALSMVGRELLRLLIQLKGESYGELKGYNPSGPIFLRKKPAELVRSIGSEKPKAGHQSIIVCDDFHKVSSIIDDVTVPECMRRVQLMRKGSKPLGFYIRDGFSIRTTPSGVQHVPGIFISRLIAGGLAESTGLLAVKDEIIEVNGIEVCGKTLDQVTDMMIANSSNLIITVKPINQQTCVRRSHLTTPVTVTSPNNRNSELMESSGGTANSQNHVNTNNSDVLRQSPSVATNSNRSSSRRQQPPYNDSVSEVPGVIDF